MIDNKQDIINRLAEIRADSGLLSKDFAAKAGIDPKNYSSIENGKRTIGDRVIQDICKAFGISPVWLKTGKGDKFKTASMETPGTVVMPCEVFDQISKLTETILSQQRTIETLTQKGGASVAGAARRTAIG